MNLSQSLSSRCVILAEVKCDFRPTQCVDHSSFRPKKLGKQQQKNAMRFFDRNELIGWSRLLALCYGTWASFRRSQNSIGKTAMQKNSDELIFIRWIEKSRKFMKNQQKLERMARRQNKWVGPPKNDVFAFCDRTCMAVGAQLKLMNDWRMRKANR